MNTKTKINIILCYLIIFQYSLCAQQPIFNLDFNDNSAANVKELVTGVDLNIKNFFNRPEKVVSNFGQALRLDGYSTFISEPSFYINKYDKALSIEAWYATDAFTKEPASIIQSINNSGGFKLQVSPYGNLIFTFFFNGIERTVTPNRTLSKYEWHHIVASVDGVKGEAIIYVDGEEWLNHKFALNAILNSADNTLWIGKTALNQVFSGFSLNTLNGAIDELRVYDVALTVNQVMDRYATATIKKANLDIDPNVRHANDYLRPQYHAMPNTSWTNEPYGLIYYEGKYHLFFQKNPNGPYLYFMHWGHLSSPDLVHWQEDPIVLAPSFGFDNFGVWSGAVTFNDKGEPVLFYTGVNGMKAGIGLANFVDDQLISWTKITSNPLIANPPTNFPSLDFRDPYVFKKDGLYTMIVGSGLANNGGGLLFTYTSNDLVSWTPQTPIFQSSDYIKNGTFWEMPSLFEINNDEFVLAVTPQFSGAPADVLYWVGRLKEGKFIPNDPSAKRLESISKNMLAPAFGKDNEDRWTYIGIIPDDRSDALQIQAGWRHTFSIPRLVRVLDDHTTLACIPHPNLCRLRIDTAALSNRSIQPNTTSNLSEFSGNQVEFQGSFDLSTCDQVNIQLFKNTMGSEFTSVILDKKTNRIGIDRRQSSPYSTVEDIRFSPYVFKKSGEVDIRIFLDHSILEVFIDKLIVFSARVYPSINSNNFDVISIGGRAQLLEATLYQLGQKENFYPTHSCTNDDLPTDLNTASIYLNNKLDIELYPNPVQDRLIVKSDSFTSYKIYNLNGLLVKSEDAKFQKEIDMSGLLPGFYTIQFENKLGIKTFKILKL